MEYPYQVVAFFDKQPNIGEPVYNGQKGWYPNVALKRRFGLDSIPEEVMLHKFEIFASNANRFDIHFLDITVPAHMPVRVIEVEPTKEVLNIHRDLLGILSHSTISKYPDREGDNYYPHMTMEWHHQEIIDPNQFVGKKKHVNTIWVLKDSDVSSDSEVLAKFNMKQTKHRPKVLS